MSKKNKNKQRQQISEEQIDPMNPIQEQEDMGMEEVDDAIVSQKESEVPEEQTQEQLPIQEEQPVVKEEPIQQTESVPVPEEVKPVPPPIKEEPKKEEVKPLNRKGVLIVEKKVINKTAEKVIPESVKKFNDLAAKYLEAMQKKNISEEDRKKAVMILSSIAQYVITASDVRVFDTCFQFMLKNRAIMLVPEVVMDGFYKYCDKTKITKITQFYVTFQSLVQSKLLNERFTLNPTTIRRTFNNDSLANWLILKKK